MLISPEDVETLRPEEKDAILDAMLGMAWSEISFERAEWRILDTRAGEPQVVPLVPEAIAILQSRAPAGERGRTAAARQRTARSPAPTPARRPRRP